LLDTSTLIDFTKGIEPLRSRIEAMLDDNEDVIVCAVTIGELYTGFTTIDVVRWEQFIRRCRYCDISLQAARDAGRERFMFARRGLQLSLPDALLAALTREQQAILVTDNLRHFPMTDIQTISLRG